MTRAQLMEEQRRRTRGAIRAAGLGVQDVWIRYFMMTGNVDEYEIDAYLHGLTRLPVMDCDLIALAVNELIDERPPLPRAPYSTDIQSDTTTGIAHESSTEISTEPRPDQGF